MNNMASGKAWARVCAAAALGWLAAGVAAAQDYPKQPIHIIIGYPPGGASDIVGRLVGSKLEAGLNQQVVVENRPGANANIGADYVAKSAPDGYTLGFGGGGPLTANPYLYKKLPYDAAKDFTMIGTVATAPLVLAVPTAFEAANLRQLVALLRAKPGYYSYGTPGGGSPQHLTSAMFMSVTGTRMTHVPYKGATPMLTDLVGGQIQLGFDNLGMIPFLKAGRLRALGVAQNRRSPVFPDVPTFAEAGVPGIESFTWYGVFAPAGTPAPVVDKLSVEIRKSLEGADVRKRLFDLGAEPMPGTAAEMRGFVESESAKWSKVIREFNVSLD